jgi:hypothetical protein
MFYKKVQVTQWYVLKMVQLHNGMCYKMIHKKIVHVTNLYIFQTVL